MSFVERFVILCPCLEESTIGGSTDYELPDSIIVNLSIKTIQKNI